MQQGITNYRVSSASNSAAALSAASRRVPVLSSTTLAAASYKGVRSSSQLLQRRTALGEGTPAGGQLFNGAAHPQHGAVLPQGAHVGRALDDPAAAGDDLTVLLGHIGQRFGFVPAESGFALLGKDVRNIMPGAAFNFRIQVDEGLA